MNGQKVWRRLADYARPFQKQIAGALVLLILGTGAELAGPYLAKIMIDNHILAIQQQWHAFAQKPQAAGQTAVEIDGQYYVREDRLPQTGQSGEVATSGQASVLAKGTSYYLVQGEVDPHAEWQLASAGQKDGREQVEVVTGEGKAAGFRRRHRADHLAERGLRRADPDFRGIQLPADPVAADDCPADYSAHADEAVCPSAKAACLVF
jgi:ATP-binding cassette subfamily B protein